MELQFEKKTCRCLDRAAREICNEELTQEMRLSDGMPDVGRVITAWGQVIVRSKEWRSGTALVSGGVMIWVLYAPEDGSEVRCVDGWIPFNLKWDVSGADREGTIRIIPLLRFVDGRAVSPRKLMVRAGVAAMGDILYPVEIELSRANDVPADVELLTKTYPMRLSQEAGEKTFLLDEDLTLPDPAPEKILCYTVQPELSEQKVMARRAVFRGNANLHLVYRCSAGKLHAWDYELPFSQFQDLELELEAEKLLDGNIALTSLELEQQEGHLRVKCGMVFQYVVDGICMVELTQDAYSPERTVEVHTQELKLPAILDQHQQIVSAQQTLPGQQGESVDVRFLPDFPRYRRDADEICFDLTGIFQVLYYGEDGSVQASCAHWMGNDTLKAGEDSKISTLIAPIGKASALSGADGMEFRTQMALTSVATSQQGIPMVTGLTLGELRQPDPDRPSLILCRNDGDLWALAKRCGSTVKAIRQANALEEEPQLEQMLLIPIR